MTTTTATNVTTQVYHVYIKASPQAIWDAITKPEWSTRYFHGARIVNTPERHHSLGPQSLPLPPPGTQAAS